MSASFFPGFAPSACSAAPREMSGEYLRRDEVNAALGCGDPRLVAYAGETVLFR